MKGAKSDPSGEKRGEMVDDSHKYDATNTSFLPTDYVVRKAERRTNLASLTLFAIVIFGVVGAFFVTNRQWASVKSHQESINTRYTQAAKDIEQLKKLDEQKVVMLAKAELTAALIEKAPRSLLLADLINRMPNKLALLEFDLESKRLDKKPRRSKVAAKKAKSLAGRGGRSAKGRASKDEDVAAPPPKPPKFLTTLVLVGVAASHEDVSVYLAQLQQSELLRDVDLKFSEFTMVDNRELIKFRIQSTLNPNADARQIQPLNATRPGAFSTDDAVAGVHDSEDQ